MNIYGNVILMMYYVLELTVLTDRISIKLGYYKIRSIYVPGIVILHPGCRYWRVRR